jgi:hypothetical protein
MGNRYPSVGGSYTLAQLEEMAAEDARREAAQKAAEEARAKAADEAATGAAAGSVQPKPDEDAP